MLEKSLVWVSWSELSLRKMNTSRQFLIGFISLGVGVFGFIVMTLMGLMLPNSKPPPWTEWLFQGSAALGIVGVLLGIGFVLVALVRVVLGLGK